MKDFDSERKQATHLLNDDVSSVEKSAIWVRCPRKRKVVKAVLLPEIWQLAARAVDDECDLVELDEFGILRCLGISNKQAILYLRRHVVAQYCRYSSPCRSYGWDIKRSRAGFIDVFWIYLTKETTDSVGARSSPNNQRLR